MSERINKSRRLKFGERFDRFFGIFARTDASNESLEQKKKLGARTSQAIDFIGTFRFKVFEKFDARCALEAIAVARRFVENSKATLSHQHDLVGAVGMLLGVSDATEASDVEDGGVARHPIHRVRTNGNHADLVGAFECIARHLAIPRLEDIERDGDLRQEDDIG